MQLRGSDFPHLSACRARAASTASKSRCLPCDVLSLLQLQQLKADDALDAKLGFDNFTQGEDRLGWLMNFTTVGAAGCMAAAGATLRHAVRSCRHNCCAGLAETTYSVVDIVACSQYVNSPAACHQPLPKQPPPMALAAAASHYPPHHSAYQSASSGLALTPLPPSCLQTMAEDRDSGQLVSAVDCYFMCQDGGMFKAKVVYAPYFYVQVKVRGRRA
jgi:hypothetical protein